MLQTDIIGMVNWMTDDLGLDEIEICKVLRGGIAVYETDYHYWEVDMLTEGIRVATLEKNQSGAVWDIRIAWQF